MKEFILPFLAIIATAFFAYRIKYHPVENKGQLLSFIAAVFIMSVFPFGFFCRCGLYLHYFLDLMLSIISAWLIYRGMCWWRLKKIRNRYENTFKDGDVL